MYNNTARILDNYEKDHFDPLIAHFAAQLAKNDPDVPEGRLDTYTNGYKDLLTQLLRKTPTVYYEALRKGFGIEMWQSLDNFINMENFPEDLLIELKDMSPESFLHFLQYIQETDVEVISPEAAKTFYDSALSYVEAQRDLEKILNEDEEEISDEQYAEKLGVTLSDISSKIGEKAANCAALSNAVMAMVKIELGLEDFDLSMDSDPYAKAIYDQKMSEIAELPSVCYGMLHAAATGRNIPSFYADMEYFDNELVDGISYDEQTAEKMSLALSTAKYASFTIKDAKAAKQYYERYSSLEPTQRTTPRTEENLPKRIKEALEDADKQYKLDSSERSAAKKQGMAKFNNFLSRLNKLGNLTKAEHDFLAAQAKIYAKENAMLDKANEKYEKAAHALNKLRIVEDMRDLTPKEQKAISKAVETLSKAETELNSLKDTLIAANRQRAERGDNQFPEHAQLREEQIRSGDTTYMPLHTREDSINQGMYGYRAHIYQQDRKELLTPVNYVVTTNPIGAEIENARTSVENLGITSTTRQIKVSERDAHEQESIQHTLRQNERAIDDLTLEQDK